MDIGNGKITKPRANRMFENPQINNASLSTKFYLGVFLVITNFIVGKIAVPFFAFDVWLGTGIYLFSWLMLLAGLLLCGREGWNYSKKWYRNFEHTFMQKFKNIFKRKNISD